MKTRIVIEISSCPEEIPEAGIPRENRPGVHAEKDCGIETEPDMYRKHRNEEEEGLLFDELY